MEVREFLSSVELGQTEMDPTGSKPYISNAYGAPVKIDRSKRHLELVRQNRFWEGERRRLLKTAIRGRMGRAQLPAVPLRPNEDVGFSHRGRSRQPRNHL